MRDWVKQWVRAYRLPAFLIGAIGLAAIFVLISVSIYYASGAYQLDLSRPEYKEVRSQIEAAPKAKDGFEAQGGISTEVLDDFLEQYGTQAEKVIEADAFAGDVLSNDQLGI